MTRIRAALDALDLAVASRLDRATAALLAEQEARRVRLQTVVRPEEAEVWQELADSFGDDRTYAAVAMGLTLEQWRALAPLPDEAWRLLRPGEWHR